VAADRKLTVTIEVAPKKAASAQRTAQLVKDVLPGDQLAGLGKVFGDQKPTQAIESVTTGFSAMTKELKRLEAAMRPDLLAKQADLELKLAKARGAYAKGLEGEKDKQQGTGFFGKLLGNLFGGGKGGKGGGNPLSALMGGGEGAGGLGELLGGAGGGIGAGGGFLAAAGPAGVAIGAVAIGLEKVVEWGTKAAEVTVGLVAKANPAVVEKLTMAMDDAQAVIGRSLTPVVETFTKVARLVGDTFATIMPDASEFQAVMAELDPIFEDIKEAVGIIGPIIKTGLVVALRQLGLAFKILALQVKPWLKLISIGATYSGLGLLLGGSGKGDVKSSVGAAARGASFFSAESLGERGYASAYGAGLSASPAKQTAENTTTIASAAKGIWDWLTGQDSKAEDANKRAVEGLGEGGGDF
jgi:hypothetical protein